MNKHLLMLSAAATALLVQSALAAPGPTTITKVGTAPIDTKTDGDITINSGGGVSISKAAAAVTVNSNNSLNNGGAISNTNTTNAKGILIDASGGPIADTTGVTNSATIDMSGTGTAKTALELSGGTFTGPIILVSSSVIKIAGDSAQAIAIDPSSVLNGDMTLSGTISASPTTVTSLQNTAPVTLVNINGAVNGNVTADASSVFTATGQGARGIVVGPTGTINACNTVAVPGCTEIGTLTNAGNVTLAGINLATGANNKNAHPESGSALSVSGNVAGGIVNAGPSFVGDTTASAVLSSSGLDNSASGGADHADRSDRAERRDGGTHHHRREHRRHDRQRRELHQPRHHRLAAAQPQCEHDGGPDRRCERISDRLQWRVRQCRDHLGYRFVGKRKDGCQCAGHRNQRFALRFYSRRSRSLRSPTRQRPRRWDR